MNDHVITKVWFQKHQDTCGHEETKENIKNLIDYLKISKRFRNENLSTHQLWIQPLPDRYKLRLKLWKLKKSKVMPKLH